MPSAYAHYRFGTQVLGGLPSEAGKAVRRFRQLFDAGLQGPDFFFYYDPIFHSGAGKLGKVFHSQTGKEFFTRAANHLRSVPSEGGTAYLYGILGHYTLDMICHPLIHAATADGRIDHSELEVEFDRFLLETDGKEPPCTQDLGSFIHLTRGDCATISDFYPGTGTFTIRHSFRNMKVINRLLAMQNRSLAEKAFRIAGAQHMVMTRHVNRNCAHINRELLAKYQQALECYPVLAAQLTAALKEGTPLGEEFSLSFS